MKYIKYKLCTKTVAGLEDEQTPVELLSEVRLSYCEANEAIAKKEAWQGEYTIEDDGAPEPTVMPSQLDIIEAQVTYTAMMTDTLLEV